MSVRWPPRSGHQVRGGLVDHVNGPQHRLNFLPEPHGQGSFLPTLLGFACGSRGGRSGSTPASRNGPSFVSGRALGAAGNGEIGPDMTGSTCDGGGLATEGMADASIMRSGSARARTRSVSGSGGGASVGAAVVPPVAESTACSCDAESSAAAGCLSLGRVSIASSTLRPCMRATRKATASCGWFASIKRKTAAASAACTSRIVSIDDSSARSSTAS